MTVLTQIQITMRMRESQDITLMTCLCLFSSFWIGKRSLANEIGCNCEITSTVATVATEGIKFPVFRVTKRARVRPQRARERQRAPICQTNQQSLFSLLWSRSQFQESRQRISDPKVSACTSCSARICQQVPPLIHQCASYLSIIVDTGVSDLSKVHQLLCPSLSLSAKGNNNLQYIVLS